MKQEYRGPYESAIGLLEIVGTTTAIQAIHFVEGEVTGHASAALPPVITDCLTQLEFLR